MHTFSPIYHLLTTFAYDKLTAPEQLRLDFVTS
ncbi:hypothetical protein SAMN05216167_1252 [Spirosoma endophyticum]|uniref:Uncharacterized protein n=1 Tax=Spirosoma endophyticum TaxID=662367 RepID=A0A1I2FAP1_9BACT|nr:hypothetical protein SAMN05216167_1252 [Spirosoma endophyticum]